MAFSICFLSLFISTFVWVASVEAYIGPGAGFAVVSSFLILSLSFLLAIFSILFWPFRFLAKKVFGAKAKRRSGTNRVVIVGLDGLDPGLASQFMAEGKLPHFQKLKETGAFCPLNISYPTISPAAWSSFMTGVDCSHHNIFDFITRDPQTYKPVLSSAEVVKSAVTLGFGRYKITLGKPKVKLLRKSKPFWTILGENDLFSSVIRVPITFPPEKFKGVLLSGMCAPDLRGTQGTFTHYTTRKDAKPAAEGGVSIPLVREGGTIRTFLCGPERQAHPGRGPLQIPLKIVVDEKKNRVRIQVSGQWLSLEPRTYSPWVKVSFRAGLISRAHGICRFYLNQLAPEVDLYVTPVQIDPERPALPISHPFIYSNYLAKLTNSYGTLGLAEDTWALNESVIDEEAFLKQAYLYFGEREEMFFTALEKTPSGLCVCVFDTTDRIQHMFFRCLDERHPANKNGESSRYKYVIEELYRNMDRLVGRVMEKIDDKTVFIVLSDHGFVPFRRGVNINAWLNQNGYLALKPGTKTSGEWFADVDWERTKAFCLGLTGLFINRKGRESHGTVANEKEFRALKRELIAKLNGLVDTETGEVAIREVMDTEALFSGPYLDNGPDLLLGYNRGYRSSWDCASGRVTEAIFEDNTKKWSGDHCVDPKLVPGVFFCNRAIRDDSPDIRDIAPTVLRLFGVPIPSYMKGKALIDESDGQRTHPPAQKESREARPDRPLDTPGAFADDQP